jgi:hypothetical protein
MLATNVITIVLIVIMLKPSLGGHAVCRSENKPVPHMNMYIEIRAKSPIRHRCRIIAACPVNPTKPMLEADSLGPASRAQAIDR